MTLTDKLITLASVAVMVVCAYQLGRFAERFRHWDEKLERLRAFRFHDHPGGTSHG